MPTPVGEALAPPPGTHVLGRLLVDVDGYRATFDGRVLDLSRSQLELLAILVTNANKVLAREDLAQALGVARHRSVDVMLSLLRKQIGRDFVRNVRNRGWIIDPDLLRA
jgi:DNA-binding response OmpR family regulator